ncbi:MAG: ribosomal protein S18-alanine N-acetyltransferase [Defluviitaleaceae bacterium]|nr:ribosomal protein S18-alanine N-acetyltransferase [Defluviitaleaceae bacterium]
MNHISGTNQIGNIRTEPMTISHLEDVYEIEMSSFSIPWDRDDFVKELNENDKAIYVVAFFDDKVVGYGGMWHIVNEGHITNIAVLEQYRKNKIGTAILSRMIQIADEKEMIGITLEVRVGNESAMKLYSKFGFKAEGLRKNYYADTKEDAVIMWKDLMRCEKQS